MSDLRIILSLNKQERDHLAYQAYVMAHNELDPRYIIEGVADDGAVIIRPISERIERFTRWRAIGDAISASRFNRPTWSEVDGAPE